MKALVLAGGFPQIRLINDLKSRGIWTILADNNPDALARPAADDFRKVNILDFDAVEAIAREENVDLVLTACADQVLLTAAKVSENLGLPTYIDYETACKVSDKAVMKKACKEHDIPTSDYVMLRELDYDKIAHLRYPLVVKPVDGYSSKGIRKVYAKEELQSAFDHAYSISRSKDIVIEEYVEGFELTVDVYVEDGVAKVLAASNTEKLRMENVFLAFRTWYPATVPEVVLEKIRVAAQKIADAFELKNTPMLIQLIVNGEDISILEYCARTGGGAKYVLLEKASGFDPFKAIVDLTLGIKPHIDDDHKPESKYISNVFIYCEPGTVFDHLEGFDELLEAGVISDYCIFKWKGAKFMQIKTSSDRAASFTFQADTLEEMKEKFATARDTVRVMDAEGNDLIRHDLMMDIPY